MGRSSSWKRLMLGSFRRCRKTMMKAGKQTQEMVFDWSSSRCGWSSVLASVSFCLSVGLRLFCFLAPGGFQQTRYALHLVLFGVLCASVVLMSVVLFRSIVSFSSYGMAWIKSLCGVFLLVWVIDARLCVKRSCISVTQVIEMRILRWKTK
jgi:hypothetical protein